MRVGRVGERIALCQSPVHCEQNSRGRNKCDVRRRRRNKDVGEEDDNEAAWDESGVVDDDEACDVLSCCLTRR